MYMDWHEETTQLLERDRGRMVNIRQMNISFAETPFRSYNLNFTGPCALECPGCHSKALWRVKRKDRKSLTEVVENLLMLRDVGLVNSICILGTDHHSKEKPVRMLVDISRSEGIISVIYSGYGKDEAIRRYGKADYYVCGPYRSGEWYESKHFYRREKGSYVELSKDDFFNEHTYRRNK